MTLLKTILFLLAFIGIAAAIGPIGIIKINLNK